MSIRDTPPWKKNEGWVAQVMAVQGTRYPERLTQATRARSQRFTPLSPPLHVRLAYQGFQTPDQNRLAVPVASRDDVHAPVHAVTAVHVGATRRTEHGTVSIGHPRHRRCVGRRVLGPAVRLGFHDDTRGAFPVQGGHEARPQQAPRNFSHGSFEEASRDRPGMIEMPRDGRRRSPALPDLRHG